MIAKFKKEFQSLNTNDICEIINKHTNHNLLGFDLKSSSAIPNKNSYEIKYVDDNNYGYYSVKWCWQPIVDIKDFVPGEEYEKYGFLKHEIVLTPFNVNIHIQGEFAPYSLLIKNRKHLQNDFFAYVNKKCPQYKKAIDEETQKFINTLDKTNDNEQSF